MEEDGHKKISPLSPFKELGDDEAKRNQNTEYKRNQIEINLH